MAVLALHLPMTRSNFSGDVQQSFVFAESCFSFFGESTLLRISMGIYLTDTSLLVLVLAILHETPLNA